MADRVRGKLVCFGMNWKGCLIKLDGIPENVCGILKFGSPFGFAAMAFTVEGCHCMWWMLVFFLVTEEFRRMDWRFRGKLMTEVLD